MRSRGTTENEEQLRICQHECRARCCRYLTVTIPAPKLKADFDEMSWFLAHEDVSLYVYGRRWHLEMRARCRYLKRDNLCRIYETRPEVCRQYAMDACEYPKRPRHTLQFDSRDEFDAWWARKRERERRRRRQRARQSRKG
jgi:Fe-S-cluster containining protein